MSHLSINPSDQYMKLTGTSFYIYQMQVERTENGLIIYLLWEWASMHNENSVLATKSSKAYPVINHDTLLDTIRTGNDISRQERSVLFPKVDFSQPMEANGN